MGRRCHAWDYSGRGIYLLTLVLSRREDALALNRMARLLAHGSPTLPPLAYRGAVCRDIDSLVRQACSPSPSP